MSYRLNSSGRENPDFFKAGYLDDATGSKDGVVAGVLDELCVGYEKDRVIIGRGKLLVSGYSVLFEGREVVGIPSDLESGAYMIVGVLNVSDRRAKSFYLAVRAEADLRQDDILKSGEGVYEVKIVSFSVEDGNIVYCASALDSIEFGEGGADKVRTESEQIYLKAMLGDWKNTTYVNDSQAGYLSQVQVRGSNEGGEGRIVDGVSSFKVVTMGKNLFKGSVIELFDGQEEEGVYAGNISNELMYLDDYQLVTGNKVEGISYLSPENGYVRFNLKNLRLGEKYKFSICAMLMSDWVSGNPNLEYGFESFCDGVSTDSQEGTMSTVGIKNVISMSFTAQGPEHEVYLYLGGLRWKIKDFQLEKGNTCTDYTPYVQSETTIEVVDKEGNRHELNGFGNKFDSVEKRNGKVVLVKRVKKGSGYITDIVPESNFYDGIYENFCEYGSIDIGEDFTIIYESTEGEKVIELDPKRANIDKIRTHEECTSAYVDAPNVKIHAKYPKNLIATIKEIAGK